MSRRKSGVEKKAKKKGPRCRMCRGRNIVAKVYPEEAVALFICQTCGYPWRSDIVV